MKVIVTGAEGQLGRELLRRAPSDALCVGFGRAELDVTDSAAVRRAVEFHRPELVLNAAAYTAVDQAETDEAKAFAINVQAVRSLAEVTRDAGAHLLQVSTNFVFDGSSSRAYRPDDTRNPLSVYGRSKAEGEDAAGPGATVVRTSWVYGSGGRNFVTTMLRLMKEQGYVRIVSDQVGAPTSVIGLAEIIWRLGQARRAGVWHHSDAGVASRYDFAVAIAEEAQARGLLAAAPRVEPIDSSEFVTSARRPKFSLLDSTRTRAVLDRTAVHWRTALREMLDREAALETKE